MCGKGVDAAVVTALVRYTLRAAGGAAGRSPSDVLHVLNEMLLAHGTDRFCTVVLVRLRLDADGWLATVASGGHPLPLHASRRRDTVGRSARPGRSSGCSTTVAAQDTEVRLVPATRS